MVKMHRVRLFCARRAGSRVFSRGKPPHISRKSGAGIFARKEAETPTLYKGTAKRRGNLPARKDQAKGGETMDAGSNSGSNTGNIGTDGTKQGLRAFVVR